METKKKACPKCGQDDGSGQNHIHDMNPEHFAKCDIRSIMERDGDNKISISLDVNVTKDGTFTATLSKEDVLIIHSYGIELAKNRLGREGYFSSSTLTGIEIDVRKVLRNCLSCEVIEEKPVILYQIRMSCTYSMNKQGEIVPAPTLSWTGLA